MFMICTATKNGQNATFLDPKHQRLLGCMDLVRFRNHHHECFWQLSVTAEHQLQITWALPFPFGVIKGGSEIPEINGHWNGKVIYKYWWLHFRVWSLGIPKKKSIKSHCMTVKKTENHQHYTNKDHKLSKKTYFTWKFGAPIWGHSLKKKECCVFSSNSSLVGGAPLQIGQRKITRIIPRIDEWKWGQLTQFCLCLMGKLMIIQWI